MKNPFASLARRITRILMRSNRLWELSQRLPNRSYFFRQRYPVIHKRARLKAAAFIDRREVLAGPFVGMKYAEEAAVGSSLWPKLFGTYESELRTLLSRIVTGPPYQRVIDVGFAEGFYLIGLGRVFPQAELVGFDLETEAARLCLANARVNELHDARLKLFGGFEPETFRKAMGPDSLVIVDCEGLENDVLASLTADELRNADWLVETHDHLVSGTTERITNMLAQTHTITDIATDDDLKSKCMLLPLPIKQSSDKYEQEALVSEGRMAKQHWLFATRRTA
jgi:hypothetical protein